MRNLLILVSTLLSISAFAELQCEEKLEIKTKEMKSRINKISDTRESITMFFAMKGALAPNHCEIQLNNLDFFLDHTISQLED